MRIRVDILIEEYQAQQKELLIIIRSSQHMMNKLQLKMPANKNRLQIKRSNQPKLLKMELNNEVSKENLPSLAQVKSKEENVVKIQQFSPIINRPSAKIINQSIFMNSNKSITSLHSSKRQPYRRSTSIKLQGNIVFAELNPMHSNNLVRQLLSMFKRKKLMKQLNSGFLISSENMQTILRFIITKKMSLEKNYMKYLGQLLKQDCFESFLVQNDKANRNQDASELLHGKITLCSMTVEVDCKGKEITNEQFASLRRELEELQKEVRRKQRIKLEFDEDIAEKQMIENRLGRQMENLRSQIELRTFQLNNIIQKHEENTEMLNLTLSKTKNIENFVQTQENKIVKQAAQYHKNLEIDLFEFADYLRHHPLGKKDYEPSIYYNQVKRMTNAELKQLTTFMAEDLEENADGVVTKGKQMAKFLEKMQHQYQLMVNELHHVIAEKTKFIQKYCSIMYLWYQNYLTKKEYLESLREGFSLEVVKVDEARKQILKISQEQAKKCSRCETSMQISKKVLSSVEKLINIYGIGNLFY